MSAACAGMLTPIAISATLPRTSFSLCPRHPRMSIPNPRRTLAAALPANNGLLQLRGVLVSIGGGDDDADEGGAGDSTNVSHTFQPSGRLSLSNSP